MKKTKRLYVILVLLFLYSCSKNDQAERAPITLETQNPLQAATQIHKNTAADKTVAAPFPEDVAQRINEIVHPAREALMAVIEKDETGIFNSYQEDIKKAAALKPGEDQRKLHDMIRYKYYDFIKKSWEQAAIDEVAYREKILSVFPDNLRKHIEFEPDFLGFRIITLNQLPKNGAPGRDLDPLPEKEPVPKPDPQPSPEPLPKPDQYKCYDALANIQEKPYTASILGASANAYFGSFNKTISTAATSIFAGWAIAENIAATNVTIPGTFNDDATMLRIEKLYKWSGNVTAYSFGAISTATVTCSAHRGMVDRIVMAVAPFIWYVSVGVDEDLSYDELVDKRNIEDVRFGVSSFSNANVLPSFSATASAYGTVRLDKWKICEIPTINF